jgi:folate-binding protein YgfZ
MTTQAALQAVRHGALLVEQPELGTLMVRGPDAQSWLNGLLTCDVLRLEVGQGAWGLALSKQGKIQSELNVLRTGDGIWVSTAPGTHSALFAALEEFLIMEDAELTDASGEHAWLALHGPLASNVAQALPADAGVHVAPIDWTGCGGALIGVPRSRMEPLVQALLANAAVLRCSAEAWRCVRIAYELPEFGTDFGPQDNPHEASLDRRAVSWTKGCYLGQEVVCMQDMRGKVKRRVIRLDAEGPDDLAPGAPVTANGEPVGEITSSCLAPGDARVMALARVSTKALDAGAALSAGGRMLRLARRDG